MASTNSEAAARLPLLNLEQLQFSWKPGTPTLIIDQLEIKQGEHLFLRGPSGSGKTTLLGLIGGVFEPDRGQIKLLNTDISQLSRSAKDRFRADHIGFIFQQFNLIPYLTVLENITLPLSFSKARKARAKQNQSCKKEAIRLLQHLGLNDKQLYHRSVLELSIGQQQRVAAARALIGQPELLIADEPTSALDTDNREAFIKLLFNECNAAGSTLVFVSHDRTLEPLFNRVIDLPDINQAEQGGQSQ